MMQISTAEAVKQISLNIRKIRESKNFSQVYVASRLGISQNAYSKFELNQSKISIGRLFQIAIALEVSVREIIEFDQGV